MTPDCEPGETVLDRDTTDHVVGEAARVAAGAVPVPRPEVLARVLAGLRDLPAAPVADGDRGSGTDREPGLPLPRRRS